MILPMCFTSFDEVTAWLDSFTPPSSTRPGLVRDARLERMRRLLDRLGHPEASFRTIHVAGSKGKGSTSRMLSSILSANGLVTGLYLSPHLVDYRERFTLDGDFFPDSLYLDVASTLREMVDDFQLPEECGYGKPSTFELYTAYAYLLFKAASCQWAVIETGLGGRLDATNTLLSQAAVITAIELEHTAILGDTIAKIAYEKSRIIKPGQKVFCGLLPVEAMAVVRAEAERQGARLYSLADELTSLETHTTKKGEECRIAFADGSSFTLSLAMRGEVQARNAALAVLTARTLGFTVHRAALEGATLPGRFELVRHNGCDIVLDVCHTRVSMAHTVSSFKALYPDRSTRCCIFAAIEGKDIHHMLETLTKAFDYIIISRPDQAKRSDVEAIWAEAKAMAPAGCTVTLVKDTRDALCEAEEHGKAILIAGSFYLASLFEEVIHAEQQ